MRTDFNARSSSETWDSTAEKKEDKNSPSWSLHSHSWEGSFPWTLKIVGAFKSLCYFGRGEISCFVVSLLTWLSFLIADWLFVFNDHIYFLQLPMPVNTCACQCKEILFMRQKSYLKIVWPVMNICYDNLDLLKWTFKTNNLQISFIKKFLNWMT